ncbi:MAG TPA: CoA transferase, partial [Steroidobacteraceae bacterium]|nr:CoA transferase [Steroidobacteraceae bacterium]
LRSQENPMALRKRTVVSLEQALSLPYATWRFAHLGWRVIRIEATPTGQADPGDPNRYIGSPVAGYDRHSYFLAQNVGKESLVLNLKTARGRAVLHRLMDELSVDVFCCNTLPGRYRDLGIDYDSLRSIRPELIWAGISAMGPAYPAVPGYDPAIQAMVGFMELTGDPAGSPTLAGIPLIDLKAGDECYTGVLEALVDREPGQGKRIDVSMLQAAASWLITTLPLLNYPHQPAEVSRSGNQHRKFIPTDVFRTLDGYIYMAVGNDIQWRRLVEIEKFSCCATPARYANAGRHAERAAMFEDVRRVFARHPTEELAQDLTKARIPWARVNDVYAAAALPAIREKLTTSYAPDGRRLALQPLPVDRPEPPRELSFPPRYGEHTRSLLNEIGLGDAEVDDLAADGTVYLAQSERASVSAS